MTNPDFEIIQRVLAGDPKAYAELVDRHKERAMTLSLRMLKNREDAEEALQDAFVRAFNALPRFEWKASFSTWFYRIVFNVCSTALARRGDESFLSVDKEREDGAASLNLSAVDKLPDALLEGEEFAAVVQEEVESLPASYGSILTLFLVQDLGYDEIVEVTGMPLGTVKTRLFRARIMLRAAVLKRFADAYSSAGVRKAVDDR
jgi:RNA polymerase sigma factor (sigma-70 family)